MIDLLCLVADKNMEATITGILGRPGALGIASIQFEVVIHPQRDPGCFFQSAEILKGYQASARHALVILDRSWAGAPAKSGLEMEEILETSFSEQDLGSWARAVVIDPELEMWVFSDSPHVAAELGWSEMPELRRTLAERRLWFENEAKPRDPKAALEWALRAKWKPRSSAIYRALAKRVSFQRCEDRSFLRFNKILQELFGPEGAAS